MARKEKKYHFIYKTTNLLSGMYYIGMHSTDDLEDGYLGSGNRLRLAVKKYGKENFEREILEFCESREELSNREREIVTLDEIAKKDCINLIVGGGVSGFKDEEHMMKCSKAGNQRFKELLENDEEFRKKYGESISKAMNKLFTDGSRERVYFYNWNGKKHTEETRDNISKAKKGKAKGEKNSQYGTCWITKDNLDKKIKKEELPQYELDGWVKGRVVKEIKGKLTELDVKSIKKLIKDGESLINISKRFNVSSEAIGKIKRGLTWKHL